jgi:hypothetical protein
MSSLLQVGQTSTTSVEPQLTQADLPSSDRVSAFISATHSAFEQITFVPRMSNFSPHASQIEIVGIRFTSRCQTCSSVIGWLTWISGT